MNDQERRRMKEELAEAQRTLDRAWQRKRDLDEEERRIERQLDPYNWGHWK
jgi:hypothetical protein